MACVACQRGIKRRHLHGARSLKKRWGGSPSGGQRGRPRVWMQGQRWQLHACRVQEGPCATVSLKTLCYSMHNAGIVGNTVACLAWLGLTSLIDCGLHAHTHRTQGRGGHEGALADMSACTGRGERLANCFATLRGGKIPLAAAMKMKKKCWRCAQARSVVSHE